MKNYRIKGRFAIAMLATLSCIVLSKPTFATSSTEQPRAFVPTPKLPPDRIYFGFVEGVLQLSADQRSNLLPALLEARREADRIAARLAPQLKIVGEQLWLSRADPSSPEVDLTLIIRGFEDRQLAVERMAAEFDSRIWEFAAITLTEDQSTGIPVVLDLIRRLIYASVTQSALTEISVEPVAFVFGDHGDIAKVMTPTNARDIRLILATQFPGLTESARATHESVWRLQVASTQTRIEQASADIDLIEATRKAYGSAYQNVSRHAKYTDMAVQSLLRFLPSDAQNRVQTKWTNITAPAAVEAEAGLASLMAELSSLPLSPDFAAATGDASSTIQHLFELMVERNWKMRRDFAASGVVTESERLSFYKDMLELRKRRADTAASIRESLPQLQELDPNLDSKLARVIEEELVLLTTWRSELANRKSPEWPRY